MRLDVRVLVFHGYLLRGTGSNVYNANLVRALLRLGHDVHLVCQERHAAELEFVGAAGDWDSGELVLQRVRSSGCTVYRPDIGGLLPVYVADRYEGIEARPFTELSDAEIEVYLRANVDAVGEVASRSHPDVALANHLVMGPAILARALSGRAVPYVVKVHGSALEYTVKRDPRFRSYAREGIAGANGVLVGSRHTAESLWAVIDDPALPGRTRLGPPGVDIDRFHPVDSQKGAARLAAVAEWIRPEGSMPQVSMPEVSMQRDRSGQPEQASAFTRENATTARALAELARRAPAEPLVAFVGKLLVAKGIDLLLVAWPSVLAAVPSARLAIVGFGSYRAAAERLVVALSDGDLSAVRTLAAEGSAAEGGPRSRLRFVLSFLDWLEVSGERERYVESARALADRVVFTGRLEHDELATLLAVCEAIVVPSTFPEAFGMVSIEAAACGALPISADHSGLREVSGALAAGMPDEARELLSFALGPDVIQSISGRVTGWLCAPRELREATRAKLVETAVTRYSWEGVARRVIAAARGELQELDPPR